MRRIWIRITVGILALMAGLLLTEALKDRRQQQQSSALQQPPCPTPSPVQSDSFRDHVAEYPEGRGLTPHEIEWFIDTHHNADLSKLWERLGVKVTDDDNLGDFTLCQFCSVERFNYDLDGNHDQETLLRISDKFTQTTRFLIFKSYPDTEEWPLIDKVDVWGKYRTARHIVVMTGGKPYLVINHQGATGSGIGLYVDEVYRLEQNGLKAVMSYRTDGYQSGYVGGPTRRFFGRLLLCDTKEGLTTATIEFTIEYSFWTQSGGSERLFSKKQSAVFIQNKNGAPSIDYRRSQITQREYDRIYNVDSMTELDFLQYNQPELLNLANHGNSIQKRWLKDYLETCDNSTEKQSLLKALGR